MQKGDVVKIRIFLNNDPGITFDTNTGWGMARVDTEVGFFAYMKAAQKMGQGVNIPSLKWTTAYSDKSGRKSNGKSGIFEIGGENLDSTTGEFTAPSDGIYKFNVNLRVNDAQNNGYFRIIIEIGKTFDENFRDGIMAIEGKPQSNAQWTGIGSIVKLKKGQNVQVWTMSNQDDDWSVSAGQSTFSGIRLGDDDLIGFHARWSAISNYDLSGDWYWIPNWEAGGSGLPQWYNYAFNNGNHFDGKAFTAPVPGIYAVEANQRFDSGGGNYYRVAICVNDGQGYDAGHGVLRGEAPSNYHTEYFASTIRLAKGDKVRFCSMGTKAHELNDQASWSMALIQQLEK